MNDMLQAAMTADGADASESQSINQEAAATIAKLKLELAKVREFEKTHGRVPTGAELEEALSAPSEAEDKSRAEGDLALHEEAVSGVVAQLQTELAESRAQTDALRLELVDLKSKLEMFSKSAEEEAERVQGATEAIRHEHAAKIDELSSLHADKIRELENALQTNDVKLQEEQTTKLATLDAEHKSQVTELSSKLEQADTEIASKQKEVVKLREEHEKTFNEMSRQTQVMQALKDQLRGFQQAKKEESDAQAALIAQLQEEVKSLQQANAAERVKGASTLAAAVYTHSEEIKAIEQQLKAAQQLLKEAEDSRETKFREIANQSKAELDAARAELESSRESHASRLQALEDELERANENASTKQAEHENALSTLQSQLEEAKKALAEASARYEKAQKNDEAQIKSVQEELSVLRSTHQAELEQLRSGSQSKHEEEIASLKVEHADQMQQLEQKLHSSQKDMSALKETHANQVKQLENQMNASLKDLDALEAGHVAEVKRVKAETLEMQQRAAEETEKTHIERVRNLEQQLNAAEAELAEAKAVHVKQLEELEKQRVADQETTLNALRASHAASSRELATQLESAQKALEAAKADHGEQLKQLEGQLSSHNTEAIESLKADHAKNLEEVGNKAKASHEQALEELQSSLAEEKRQLELQSKSLQSDLEGTRFQIQSLKGILHSMEEEGKEKEQEYAAGVEKLEGELSRSVMKLSEQSARMMDLQMQHDQSLAEAKRALVANSQRDLDSLKEDHEKAFADLRGTLEAQHKEAMDKAREEHARSVEVSQDLTKAGNDELRKQLKEQHDAQLDEVMKTLETQWKSQVDQLEEQNAAASARLATEAKGHEESMQRLKTEHESALSKLHSELKEARDVSASSNATELDDLRTQVSRLQAQVREAENQHNNAMVAAINERDSALTAMKQELAEAREAVAARPDATEFDELNTKFVTAQKELDDLHKKHDHAVRESKAQYDTHLERLLTELNEARQASGKVSDPNEIETVKASLDEAKKTIASLESELEGAMLEVETQRNLAEEAQKESEQLKLVKKEAEEVALPSPKQRRKSRSPKRKSANHLSSPGAPKPGLEASRWANPEASTTVSTSISEDQTTEPVSDVRGGDGNEGTAPATEEDKMPSGQDHVAANNGKRNIAGQLAGIQEQIKQLDDLSEDFLEEHQKMARTLSRVDDRTTSTINVDKDDDLEE